MKKILACLLILTTLASSLSSCNSPEKDRENSENNPINVEQTLFEDKQPPFISQDTKNSWEADIKAILSMVHIWEPKKTSGSHAVGLMDLNFDSIPEVLVAYPGGSIGNIAFTIYDLRSHSPISYYDGMYYKDSSTVRVYVAKTSAGYVTLAQGSIRNLNLGWCNVIEQLSNELDPKDYYLETPELFVEALGADTLEQGPYFFRGEKVEKVKYDEEHQRFLNLYQPIESTEMQLISWLSLEGDDRDQLTDQMINALLNSPQQFIDMKEAAGELTYSDWKAAYLDVTQKNQKFYVSYALVYIDDNDIPELYMSGGCEAYGDCIYSFKNGRITVQSLKRIGGGRYVERTGAIINENGHMGRYYTDVYMLDANGFTQTFNGVLTERVEYLGNEEYNIISEYTIDGESVSEADFNATVNASFDFAQSLKFYDIAVSYDAIIQQLTGYSYDGK